MGHRKRNMYHTVSIHTQGGVFVFGRTGFRQKICVMYVNIKSFKKLKGW